VAVKPLAYEDAIVSGEVEWGTYREKDNPVPVMGHVSVRAFPEAFHDAP